MDYSYQNKAAEIVLNNALNKNYIASVLGACCSSGKTTISHIIINNYLKLFPQAKIVVLTEGQNMLKNQYLEELKNSHISINFNYGTFFDNTQVQVGIPQNIQNLKINHIDLLIVDECQNFYKANTDQEIIKYFNPTHQIIMTGSPTKFNLHNKNNVKKFAIHYISAEELEQNKIFSGVDLDVIKITFKNNVFQTMNEVMKDLNLKKINVNKLMVDCPTIDYAKKVYQYFKTNFNKSLYYSDSNNDKNNENINNFKKAKEGILIVINKGILGFNDPAITSIVDLKSSNNIDASFQLMARILRVHPNNIRKSYFRISEKKDYNKQVLILHKMVSLMKKEIFKKYDGKNLKITIERK
ncbi:MAG: DEAD/DEAH box helicase family protein [Candidatus Nanoarchaeia archaeon]|nr:DEAD/DEAH box helicase family protein [Candidatus Nanoarchaeia archaeon]